MGAVMVEIPIDDEVPSGWLTRTGRKSSGGWSATRCVQSWRTSRRLPCATPPAGRRSKPD